jgi:hypothetical protein
VFRSCFRGLDRGYALRDSLTGSNGPCKAEQRRRSNVLECPAG